MIRRLSLSLIASCISLAGVGCESQNNRPVRRITPDTTGVGDVGVAEEDAGEDTALDTIIADTDAAADTDTDADANADAATDTDVDAAADADATADTAADTESDTAPATRPCVVPNGTGTETWTGSDYGSCVATACESGYHIESSSCTSDTRTCSPLPANTTDGTQVWTGSAYGSCTATACASGYSVVGGVCVTSPAPSTLGAACTLDVECASGFCATSPTGTANDRCAPPSMNYIPSGTFTLGSLGGSTAENTVTLSRAFFMGQTEVTQGQWKAVSGGVNPSVNSPCGDACPAENLDWFSAAGFANAKSIAEGLTSCYTLTGCVDPANGWKDGEHYGCTGATFSGLTCTGYRLPTEAEWEYAARAGTTTDTYMGNLSGSTADCTTAQPNLDSIAWWCKNARGGLTWGPQAVGGKAANSFGLWDMLGNVSEWTGDWYYRVYPWTLTDPTGPTTGSERVFRGGAWSYPAEFATAAFRNWYTADLRGSEFGFRLVRTVP